MPNQIWDYLPYGPFATAAELADWMHATCTKPDPYFFAIIDQATHRAVGVASYLRINPDSGSIEVGHINFAPQLQSTIDAHRSHVFNDALGVYGWISAL